MIERQADNRGEVAGIAVRAVASSLGAYAVAYYLTEALAGGFFAMGLSRVDAAIVSSTVGLLVFPVVSLWAFAERRAWLAAAAPGAASVLLALVSAMLRP